MRRPYMVGRTVVRPYIRLFEPSNYGVVKGNWYKVTCMIVLKYFLNVVCWRRYSKSPPATYA